MKTYAPEEGSMIVDGNILEQWNSIGVARDEDGFTFEPSTSGGGTRTKNSNEAGKFTITLQQTSPSNGVLSDLAKSGDIVPCSFRDNSGSDVHESEAGYVVKPSDSEYAKEVGTREWVIQCEKLDMDVRGN